MQVVVRIMAVWYHGSLEIKCSVSDAKSLMLTYTLNLTLNLNNIVNKSKCEIKTYLLKQPYHFVLLLQVFELLYRVFHRICTHMLYIVGAVLYRVRKRASLPSQKSHTYSMLLIIYLVPLYIKWP